MAGDLLTRPDRRRARAVDALTRPGNIAVAAAVTVAGIVLATWWLIAVAAACYAALAALTFLDTAGAERAGAHAAGPEEAPVQLAAAARPVAPGIAARLDAARGAQAAIEHAIEDADLPAGDIRAEVDELLATLTSTGVKADRVGDYLASHPKREVEMRIAALRGEDDGAVAERTQAIGALERRLSVLRRVRARYDDLLGEMDHVVASLEALHAEVVTLGAAEDEWQRRNVAGQVRALREGVQVLSGGMEEAYAETRASGARTG